MITNRQKYYYAVVNKKGHLILESGNLPIFWYRRVAKRIADKFKGATVKRIKHDELVESFLS